MADFHAESVILVEERTPIRAKVKSVTGPQSIPKPIPKSIPADLTCLFQKALGTLPRGEEGTPHFTPATLKFLRALKRNNDRGWFSERKPIFERDLKAPMLALITSLNEAMLSFAPEHVREPNKIMMRIYRDTRFSPDKRPYKHNIAAWWAREGLQKTSGAGFYLHLTGTELVIAAGVYMPEREQLLALRRHLSEHHGRLRQLSSATKLRKLLTPEWETAEGLPLSRPPKGFSKEDPAYDLIRCRQWGLGARLPAELATESTLHKTVVDSFRAAAPIVAFLNEPLSLKPRKPLF